MEHRNSAFSRTFTPCGPVRAKTELASQPDVLIVLRAAEGLANRVIAQKLSTSVPTVLLWRKQYERAGLEGILKDRPRSGPLGSPRHGIGTGAHTNPLSQATTGFAAKSVANNVNLLRKSRDLLHEPEHRRNPFPQRVPRNVDFVGRYSGYVTAEYHPTDLTIRDLA